MMHRVVYVVTAVLVDVDGQPMKDLTASQEEAAFEQTLARFCEVGAYDSWNDDVQTHIVGHVVATENPVLIPAPPFRPFDFERVMDREAMERQAVDPATKFPRKIKKAAVP